MGDCAASTMTASHNIASLSSEAPESRLAGAIVLFEGNNTHVASKHGAATQDMEPDDGVAITPMKSNADKHRVKADKRNLSPVICNAMKLGNKHADQSEPNFNLNDSMAVPIEGDYEPCAALCDNQSNHSNNAAVHGTIAQVPSDNECRSSQSQSSAVAVSQQHGGSGKSSTKNHSARRLLSSSPPSSCTAQNMAGWYTCDLWAANENREKFPEGDETKTEEGHSTALAVQHSHACGGEAGGGETTVQGHGDEGQLADCIWKTKYFMLLRRCTWQASIIAKYRAQLVESFEVQSDASDRSISCCPLAESSANDIAGCDMDFSGATDTFPKSLLANHFTSFKEIGTKNAATTRPHAETSLAELGETRRHLKRAAKEMNSAPDDGERLTDNPAPPKSFHAKQSKKATNGNQALKLGKTVGQKLRGHHHTANGCKPSVADAHKSRGIRPKKTIRGALWNDEEDRLFNRAYKKFGRSWKQIQEYLLEKYGLDKTREQVQSHGRHKILTGKLPDIPKAESSLE